MPIIDHRLAERIAQQFTTMLFTDLGTRTMREVISRNNADGDDTVCHSHDFCDANMVMFDAFVEESGREPDVGLEDDAALCNEAWRLAKLRFESVLSSLERR